MTKSNEKIIEEVDNLWSEVLKYQNEVREEQKLHFFNFVELEKNFQNIGSKLGDIQTKLKMFEQAQSKKEQEFLNDVLKYLESISIFICPKCGFRLLKEDMGKKCPRCFEWQYHHFAQKININFEELKTALSKMAEGKE